ncbi:MAG TPA: hypothetical protein VIJ60_02050 [Acidimicrobiales bacterium]|jgi:hypothetical protein
MSPTLSKAVTEGRDELTPEEAERFADEQAQQYLGMSIEEFRKRAAADDLPEENPMAVHIALLAGVELQAC